METIGIYRKGRRVRDGKIVHFMDVITLKYCRPTDTEHGHTKVFVGAIRKRLIGYMMQDRNPQRVKGENWVFTFSNGRVVKASNRGLLIRAIKKSLT